MAADLALIAANPANAALAGMVEDSRRSRHGEPYSIDGWSLRAHPDLEDRLRALASGLPGVAVAGYCGYPVLVDGEGVVCALATGTSGLLVRLADGPARDAILAHGGEALADLGPEWVRADPWLSSVPSADGTALLHSWLAASLRAVER
jgi:hypothetical protein